jgi:hypothetical protein
LDWFTRLHRGRPDDRRVDARQHRARHLSSPEA